MVSYTWFEHSENLGDIHSPAKPSHKFLILSLSKVIAVETQILYFESARNLWVSKSKPIFIKLQNLSLELQSTIWK